MFIQLLALDMLILHPVMATRPQDRVTLIQVRVLLILIPHPVAAVTLTQRPAESMATRHQDQVIPTQRPAPITILHPA